MTRVRAATGGHSQLTLRRDLDVLDGIAFGRSDIAEVVHEGDRLDVVARLTSRRFGGFESLQLDIRDVATSGSHPRDRGRPRATAVVAPSSPAGVVVTRPVGPAGRGRRPIRSASARPGRWLAPVLSIVGLLLVALVTLSLLSGGVPVRRQLEAANGNGNGNGDGGPARTPAPSNVVIVPPEVVTFKGSIVYAKAGNIWVQTGKDVKQLTTGGDDSMPSWSPDGTSIYFIRTADGDGPLAVAGGVLRDYAADDPERHAGQGRRQRRARVASSSGKVTSNGRTWHSWIRAAGPVARRHDRWRWSRTARTRRRATSSSSSTT